MESRKSEIESLVPSFVACLQPIIGRYRGMKDAEDVVKHFEIRVEAERTRYKNKFSTLKEDPSCADLRHIIEAVEHQVNQIADNEIARAKAAGKVEHDHIATAIRETQRGLANAVSKLENKGNNNMAKNKRFGMMCASAEVNIDLHPRCEWSAISQIN
jgi:hypothetical protein